MKLFEDLDRKQQKLLDTSMFLGKLLLAGLIFRSILFLYPDTTGLQSLFATTLLPGLKLFSFQPELANNFIGIGKNVYVITQDCLGWKSIAAFTGLVFASEGLKKNLKIVFAGSALIMAANYIRVLTTIILSERGVISFQVIHDFLWKWGLTLLVLVFWGYWLKQSRGSFK